MNKKRFSIMFLVLFFAAPFSAFAAFHFERDLQSGDQLFDVLVLQRTLNLSSDTLIAETGLGSSGNETDYFGSLTKAAVIRFQNKYASEVLTPAGLTFGTGFVGLFTRNKLNQIIDSLSSTTAATFFSGSTSYTNSTAYSPTTSTNDSQNYTYVPFQNGSSTLWQVTSPNGATSYYSTAETVSTTSSAVVSVSTSTGNITITTGGNTYTYNSNNSSDSSGGGSAFFDIFGNFAAGVIADIISSLFSSGASTAAITVPAATAPAAASAVTTVAKVPFGGKILRVTPCTCNPPAWQIDILDTKGVTASASGKDLPLVYIPGVSKLYAYYNIYTPGVETLGTYLPTGVCMVWVGEACVPNPGPIAMGTIEMVGTSATPGSAAATAATVPTSEATKAFKNTVAYIKSLPGGVRSTDGRLIFSTYSSTGDSVTDSNTAAGIGNKDNYLSEGSVALSPDLIKQYNPTPGASVYVNGQFVGYYDDSTASSYNGTSIVNTIDIYDQGDALGEIIKNVPAGEWKITFGEVRPQVKK